jgi:energy-coupling factor transporter transmembrane protein EcfT
MTNRDLQRRRAAPLLLGSLVGALVAGHIAVAVACGGVAIVAAWMAGARVPRALWWRMLLGSALVAIVLNAFLISGAALGPRLPWGLHASREGLMQGVLLALRLVVAAIALRGLAFAWPGERAADEIAARLRPLERLRVPVKRARAVAALALRFVPLLGDELRRLVAIQDLRAGRAPRGPVEQIERVRSILMPAMVGSLERADQLALVLEARHYQMREPQAAPPAGWSWRGAGWVMAGVGLLWR